ncbi:MAG: hypothetical protein GDA46_02600 [Bdellovibrionales bacterium]|nr:hypothetical protein [Bdellovibrionales bacterium]
MNILKKDSNYYIQNLAPHLNLVVSEEFVDISPYFFYYIKLINSEYNSLFKENPFKKNSYLRTNTIYFSSPRYQLSRAHVFLDVRPFVHIYPSREAFFMDVWSLFDWTQNSLIHELNHVYQLTQIKKWENFFWPLLSVFLAHSEWSTFFRSLNYKNKFLPSWILEGDAVFSESLYGTGGRLWSGVARAFVFAQIKEDQIPLKRLLKLYKDPFSSLEKYLHGAFFFTYLYSKYDLKTIKNFFYESSLYLPLDYYGLNSSLKRAFGLDLKTLFQNYKKYYLEKAKKQKSSSQPLLFRSKLFAPLNSDKEDLFFLISDAKSPSELIIWNKRENTFKKSKVHLPIGKVFKKKGKYISPGYMRLNSSSVEFTLSEEDFKPILKYNSKYVMDFYGDKALFLDMQSSHLQNALYFGDSFYDSIHSSALVDSKGSVYYFKQDKDKRVLYKNKKPLVELKTYFAYLVEVNPKAVYFISSTDYGSSLFVYKKDEGIYRLSESDRIVSARQVEKDKFLVIEIGTDHYEYKMISSSKISKKPTFYNDLFKKKPLFQDSFHEISLSSKKLNSYHSFSNLLLKQMFLQFFPYFSGSIKFEDPLKFNDLSLNTLLSKSIKRFKALYSYKKYRPEFDFSLNYDKEPLQLKKGNNRFDFFHDLGLLRDEDIYITEEISEPRSQDSFLGENFKVKRILKRKRPFVAYERISLSLGLNYPVFESVESSLFFSSIFKLGQGRFLKNSWFKYIQNRGEISYRFKRKYPYAYFYNKRRNLKANYKLFFIKNQFFLNASFKAGFVEELGREFFLNLQTEASWGLLNFSSFPLQFKNQEFHNFLVSESNSLYELNLNFLKVYNRFYYPLKIPLGLIRFAPLAGMSFLVSENHRDSFPRNFYLIPFIGWEGEFFLFSDKNSFKAGLSLQKIIEAKQGFLSDFSKNDNFQFSTWISLNL